jgi:hypothetical protein
MCRSVVSTLLWVIDFLQPLQRSVHWPIPQYAAVVPMVVCKTEQVASREDVVQKTDN